MKNLKPSNLALRNSLIIGLIVLCVLLWIQVSFENLDWWVIALVSLFSALTSFIVFYRSLNLFINTRLEQLYKAVNIANADKANVSQDPIENASVDIERWAVIKEEEIAELKKLSAYRRKFLGNVSHELKTPIFAADGYIQTLIDSNLEDKDINMKYLKKAAKNLDRLNQIVEDLSLISQYESDELTLEKTKFDLVHLTKDIFDALDIKAEEFKVELKLSIAEDIPVLVKADKAKIEQVLTNLVYNGIVYGNTGGFVQVAFYDMDSKIMIEVSDDGPGIAKEHHHRLFERFYRVDESRSRDKGGTGLGLAIVKHIIVAHGESISVRSELGKGTTFNFSLSKAV